METRPAMHLGPKRDDTFERERFKPRELAIVLSYYDLGVIESIREFPRGSRRAPKARIRTRDGEFLLKRRAPGRDDPFRVAFAHRLQLQLAEHEFPIARLIGTRIDNNSMVQHGGRVYEMFEYVRGSFFSGSNREAQYAGFTLARLHRLLRGHELVYDPPEGSYHGATGIGGTIEQLPGAVRGVDAKVDIEGLRSTCAFLEEAYRRASATVDSLGYGSWRRLIIHGDWHPGNLLFDTDRRVKAVIDFDSARREARVVDLANGALQFSMMIGEDALDPDTWPDQLAVSRIRAFVRGYDQASGSDLSPSELKAVPWLIVEAMVAESVVPIATTGSFARIPGEPFLKMIERKVRWLVPRIPSLIKFISKNE